MKYLISILIIGLSAGCASHDTAPEKPVASTPATHAKRSLRTSEIVKTYSAGRYTDPNYPDEMHERHTVYRREQGPDWNYLPDASSDLPTGPGVNAARASQSYYAKAEGELNTQQQAFAEALQEQNRALKKRIDSLQQEAGRVPELQSEIDRLKKQIDEPPPAPANSEPASSPDDAFSGTGVELPIWGEGIAFSSEENLLSEMQLNDQLAAELATVQRRKILSALNPSFLRPASLALLKR